MKRAMLMGVLLGGLAASGCIIREVRVGDDGQGGAAGAVDQGPWGCLDEEPAPPTNALVSLQLEVTDQATRGPRTDANVRACSPFDPLCSTPLGDAVRVDLAGKATIQVPEDFIGYLQVYGLKGPDVDDPDFVRTMVYLPTREVLRGAQGRGILVFNTTVMRGLAALGGGTFETEQPQYPEQTRPGNTGLVLLSTLDCASKPAAGISYELIGDAQRTEQTSGFYVIGPPGMNLPQTTTNETDRGGAGGFTNVKAGLALFTAKLNTQERFVTKETGTAVFVRPGWYTQAYISP